MHLSKLGIRYLLPLLLQEARFEHAMARRAEKLTMWLYLYPKYWSIWKMEQTALGLAFLFSNPPFEASRIKNLEVWFDNWNLLPFPSFWLLGVVNHTDYILIMWTALDKSIWLCLEIAGLQERLYWLSRKAEHIIYIYNQLFGTPNSGLLWQILNFLQLIPVLRSFQAEMRYLQEQGLDMSILAAWHISLTSLNLFLLDPSKHHQKPHFR